MKAKVERITLEGSRTKRKGGKPGEVDQEINFADFADAWESDDGNGVCLKTTGAAGGGSVLFFPEPFAAKIREALGSEIKAHAPEKPGRPRAKAAKKAHADKES